MAGLVTDYMQETGIQFLWKSMPKRLDKNGDGTISVGWRDAQGKERTDVFDTVLFAIGKANFSICSLQ